VRNSGLSRNGGGVRTATTRYLVCLSRRDQAHRYGSLRVCSLERVAFNRHRVCPLSVPCPDAAGHDTGGAGNGNGQTTSGRVSETRGRLRGGGTFTPGGDGTLSDSCQVRERHGDPGRKTGSLEAGPQVRRGHGRFAEAREWIRERMAGKSDTTLDELTAALREERLIKAHRSPVGRLLHRLGPSHGNRTSGQASGSAGMWRRSATSR